MDVVLIGAGNVGTVLGRTFKQAGHTITAIWNRDSEKAKQLADELGTLAVSDLKELPQKADVFLLAVSDKSIQEVAHQLTIVEGVLVHIFILWK
jgi:predicted dinucleotide-binding enzyme